MNMRLSVVSSDCRFVRAVLGIMLLAVLFVGFSPESVTAIACPTDKGARIDSGYGVPRYKNDGTFSHYHNGLDLGVAYRPIYAARAGEVKTNWYDGYQITKDLHAGSRVYRYAHLSEGGVSGQVNEGDDIGKSGDGSGYVVPHLHWELRTDGGGFYFPGTADPTDEYKACGGGSSTPAPSGTNPGTSGPVANPNDVGSSDCHNLVLRQGNVGGCVRHLQVHLNDFGYNLGLDSDFGQQTKNAVVNFQSNPSRGLSADGVVGPATWNALHAEPGASGPTPVNNPVSVSGGSKRIQGEGSGKCLDVSGESQADGAATILWDCHGRANQQWRFENGMIKVYGNKCLDVRGQGTGNGATVQIWECYGGSNQRWALQSDGRISIYGTMCLDVRAAATHNGADIQIWECYGADNQLWVVY